MSNDTIPISPAARAVLVELADQTGRPATELLDAAMIALQRALSLSGLDSSVPGVKPADVWEAVAQADAGRLIPHADVFARLRGRQ